MQYDQLRRYYPANLFLICCIRSAQPSETPNLEQALFQIDHASPPEQLLPYASVSQ